MGKTKGKIRGKKPQKRVKSAKTAKKPKKTHKLKPIKIAALILSAIHDLSESKGSTPNKISGYISYASNLPEHKIKRQVNMALKRGVEYGVLRRYRGHYFLPTGDELDRANRIAMRFARLASPAPSNLLSTLGENSGRVNDTVPDVTLSRTRKSVYPLRNKKSKRMQSLSVSPDVSNSDASWNKDETSIASDVE